MLSSFRGYTLDAAQDLREKKEELFLSQLER